MGGLVKTMLKGGKQSKFTQVDDFELVWGLEHICQETVNQKIQIDMYT